jgi:hypothetical protein
MTSAPDVVAREASREGSGDVSGRSTVRVDPGTAKPPGLQV